MTATAPAKKIRYRSLETGTFKWALPDELPDYAHEQEAVKKALGLRNIEKPAEEKVNDYSEDIAQWRAELRTALDDLRAARDDKNRNDARNRCEQYKQAIDIYSAAEQVPAVVTQFGSYREDFFFRVPPVLDEYRDLSPIRTGFAHRYVTADPVEIAYLRTFPDYEEVPVGHVYSKGKGEREGIWVPIELYERQRAIGQAV